MHPLLQRQLKRLALTPAGPVSAEDWQRCLGLVDGAYHRADEDRELLERSLSISSREMGALNESLRASEAALSTAHDKLQATIACLDEGLCLLDQQERAVFLNPEGQRLLGRTEVAGLRLLELVAPHVAWDTSRHLSAEQAHFVRADGEHVPVSYTLNPIPGVGTVLAFRDISALVRAKNHLERSHQQLQAIIRSAPIAMAMLDGSLRYVACSERWITDWRLRGEAIIGKAHFDVFPDIPDEWREVYRRALDGQVFSCPEEAFRRGDGSVIHVRWAAHPWLSPDGEVGGIVIVSDCIDDLVRAREAALDAARTKAQFLANMSHEIRTPMNGVIGMTELLLSGDLNVGQREYAETIYESADSLLRIINEILDFSKLEAGRVKLEDIEFDPRVLIQSVIDLLAERAQRKAIEIACFSYQDVPRSLRGDPGRLRQVLVNLVGNAVKFTERGNVTLTLQRMAEATDQDGALLRFEVEDTGIGIDSEARRTVFDAFTQADGSTTRRYGGSGLGLAISKQLVETMGGTIEVDSEPGQGSRFWFTLPFKNGEARGAPPEPRRELAGLRALVVDDNPVNRRILELRCSEWGVAADLVPSAEDALARLRAEALEGRRYDMMLVDFAMPNMDGLELARTVRDDPGLSWFPMVLLSSMVDRTSAEEIAAAGFTAYMTKPLHEQALYDTLRSAMGATIESSRSPASLIDVESMFVTDFNLRMRVLLVEDNAVNRKVAVHMLKKLGCTVDVAEDGWRAVEAIRDHAYELVFMDCQMPGLDGFEATRMVRELERQGSGERVTIVALTAHAMAGDRERCLEAGMDEYLTKPLKLEKLSDCLRSFCRRPLEVADAGEPQSTLTPPR